MKGVLDFVVMDDQRIITLNPQSRPQPCLEPKQDKMRVTMHDLKVHALIGAYTEERQIEQPLHLNLNILCETYPKDYVIDYALLERAFIFILERGKFRLLEDACKALLDFTQCVTQAIAQAKRLKIACQVQIIKPNALEQTFPALEISREWDESNPRSLVAWENLMVTLAPKNENPPLEIDPLTSLRLSLNHLDADPEVGVDSLNESINFDSVILTSRMS